MKKKMEKKKRIKLFIYFLYLRSFLFFYFFISIYRGMILLIQLEHVLGLGGT
jgi:hypothetical protein